MKPLISSALLLLTLTSCSGVGDQQPADARPAPKLSYSRAAPIVEKGLLEMEDQQLLSILSKTEQDATLDAEDTAVDEYNLTVQGYQSPEELGLISPAAGKASEEEVGERKSVPHSKLYCQGLPNCSLNARSSESKNPLVFW